MRSSTARTRRALLVMIALTAISLAPRLGECASLSPSRSSLARQNAAARRHDFTYLVTRSQLQRFVANGWLVPLDGNSDYRLKDVSFPFARPEVRLFVERLASQYRDGCGEALVVTSLTRPKNYQPPNASPLSVHPTGMALDLRRPNNWRCRSWLEGVLSSLEDRRVLEATRERFPPHYHVAVFPQAYSRYVERLTGDARVATHLVSRGDTLWKIARAHSTTVGVVKQHNGLRSNRIYPGQLLEVPLGE